MLCHFKLFNFIIFYESISKKKDITLIIIHEIYTRLLTTSNEEKRLHQGTNL